MDLLEAEPPAFSPADVVRLLGESYGFAATDLRPLDSVRDQMFFVDSAGGPSVLKISNPAERPDTLDMENRAMRHLAEMDPALPIARPIFTAGGEPVGSALDGRSRRHLVRLITALVGRSAEGRSVSLDLAANVGDVCARVSVGLQGFFHAGAGRPIGWDIRIERPAPADPGDPVSVRLAGARRRIGPALAATRALPSGVQHADVTLTNILREDDDTVTGVIDFGDMHHTANACDLAVSMTSVLRSTAPASSPSPSLSLSSGSPPSPWELAAAFLDSYLRRRPLLPAEAQLLGHLVLARIVTTLDISRARAARHPDNRAYITQYDEGRGRLLEMLTDLTDDEVVHRFARLAGCRSGGPAPIWRPGGRPSWVDGWPRRSTASPYASTRAKGRGWSTPTGTGTWTRTATSPSPGTVIPP